MSGLSEAGVLFYIAVGPRFAANHSHEAYAWEGVSRNISCFPLAEPPASVEWSRFGQTIVNNDTYKVIRTTSASFLQVQLHFTIINVSLSINIASVSAHLWTVA